MVLKGLTLLLAGLFVIGFMACPEETAETPAIEEQPIEEVVPDEPPEGVEIEEATPEEPAEEQKLADPTEK